MPVIGELELGWRMLANRFVARHRHERQDDRRRVARPRLARGRGARARSPATSARRSPRSPATLDPDDDGDLRVLVLPARGLGRLRARGRACCSTSPPTTSTATARFAAYLDAKLRIFANQTDGDDARSSTPTSRRWPASTSPARRAARRYGIDGCEAGGCAVCASPTARSATPTAPLVDRGELAARRRAQPPQRDGGRRRGARRRDRRAMPSPRGLRTFAGVPHRLERVAEIDGVTYVNDSKATNVAAAAAALARLRRRRPRDPRRQPQGRRLRGARPGRRRALRAPAT